VKSSPISRNTVTLDLGNTALKLAIWDVDTLVERHRWYWRAEPQKTWQTVSHYLATQCAASVNVGLCSVVPSQNKALMAQLLPHFSVHPINPVDKPMMHLRDYPSTQLGADRWVNALAACQLVPDATSIMIMSMGTSTTIDLVSRQQEQTFYEGGAILPGIKLFAQSLPTVTDRLPETPLPEKAMLNPGKNTLASLQTGLSLGYTGLIHGFIAAWQPQAVVLTGGDAPLFASIAVNCDNLGMNMAAWHHQPLLTHYGIRVAMSC
jgi:type III pantothenate kinase